MYIMLDFHQKRKIKSVVYNKVTLIILLLLVLMVARSTWVVFKKERTSAEMKNLSLKNVQELRDRNKELELKIKELETGTGIEEEIRLKFDVVKGDENMVVVVDDKNSDMSTTTEKVGWWEKVKYFLTN
jgi:cell division protein FtsB